MKRTILLCLITFLSVFLKTDFVEAQNINSIVSLGEISYTSEYDRDDDMSGNCADFAPTIRIGGYFILILKIVLPLIIIFKTSISLMKTITKGSPDELNKAAKKMGISLIAGIMIFFIPTIVNVIFGFVDKYNDNKTDDSEICRACILEPLGSTCSSYADM